MEVLSVTESIGWGAQSLRCLSDSFKEIDSAFSSLVSEASKFLSSVRTVIATSVPHIYISALPFAPKNSRFANAISTKNVLSVVLGHGDWPNDSHLDKVFGSKPYPLLLSLMRATVLHNAKQRAVQVRSLDFDSDSDHIVTGSAGGRIRVWNVASRKLLCECRVSDNAILLVAFVTKPLRRTPFMRSIGILGSYWASRTRHRKGWSGQLSTKQVPVKSFWKGQIPTSS